MGAVGGLPLLQRERQMKTLVNKNNPQITISAPEIEQRKAFYYDEYLYIIKGMPWLDAKDWTLIDDTPEMSRLTQYVYRTLKFVNESNISNEKLKDVAPYFASCFRGAVMEDIQDENADK